MQVNVALLILLCLLGIGTEAKERNHSSSKLTPLVFLLIVDCLKVLISNLKKEKASSWCFSHFASMCLSFSAEAPHTSKRVSVLSNEEMRTLPERSWSSGPDHQVSVITEMFVTDENIGKMENILDTWSNNLKVSARYCWRPWKIFKSKLKKYKMTIISCLFAKYNFDSKIVGTRQKIEYINV